MTELTSEQEAAAESVVKKARSAGMGTLGGYAGTGKTTILSHLHRTLRGWAFVAYTGKATSNLRRKGIGNAATIHSTIYTPHGDPPTFELKAARELDHVQGFAIDEASMVGGNLLRDLRSFGRPVVAVGDHGQLPPVNDEAGLMLRPDFRLERIHRNAGPIAEFAEWMREGEDPEEWRGDPRRVKIIRPGELTIEEARDADQVITGYNDDRRATNLRIRAALGRSGPIPVAGDRIIVLKNFRELGVYNGMQGVVVSTWNQDHLTLDTGHSFKFTFDETKFGVPIDYAYCLTCHKSQGDEWERVVVKEARRTDLWPHAKWTYTAASRAKEHLTWVLNV